MPKGKKTEAARDAAALLLARGATVKETATLSGASESTISNWQKEPRFAARVKAIQAELFAVAAARLAGMSGKAAGQLEALLDDSDAKVRLGAVRLVADWSKSVREAGLAEQLDDLRRVLAEVEARVNERPARAGEGARAASTADGGGPGPADGAAAGGPGGDPDGRGDAARPLADGPSTLPLWQDAASVRPAGG
jgi:hypothetical protein